LRKSPVEKERVQRRLAAILAADMAGYSRLTGLDEEGTIARLRALRRELIDPTVAEHRGRIVKTTGDGLLIEFGSVVDAVRCAVEVQRGMTTRNTDVPADRRIEFRVGIHLGDVVVEGGDLLGDGVNVAARLETVAEPGGICMSEDAYRQVRDKVPSTFIDSGGQQFKNISRPVRVYRLAADLSATIPSRAAPPLPDKPSIAVLPFQNMSGDPEQEYFADGVVEEIITALSRFRNLFVIARNSSFTYKGRAVDVKQVGRELGVRYVLEGSVRKAGSRVRITGQLIDTATGAHLWADRVDGALEDIFDLQDRVTANVVGAIAPKLEQAEIERVRRKPTDSLDAYDFHLRGMASLYQWSREPSEAALRLFYRAIELDPDFALGYGMAARCQLWRRANGWWTDQIEESAETVRFARRAVELGKDDADALAAGAFALAVVARDLDAGASYIDRALAINPNLATAWHFSSWIRLTLGEPELALEHEQRAMRLSPVDPLMGQMQVVIAVAHFCAGRFGEASSWAERAVRDLPTWRLGLAIAAASNALAGRLEAARAAASRLRQMDPTLRISRVNDLYPFRRPDDVARWAEGLRQAGLQD
jgi:TolB-like protein